VSEPGDASTVLLRMIAMFNTGDVAAVDKTVAAT
jgi:hypothetical protein